MIRRPSPGEALLNHRQCLGRPTQVPAIGARDQEWAERDDCVRLTCRNLDDLAMLSRHLHLGPLVAVSGASGGLRAVLPGRALCCTAQAALSLAQNHSLMLLLCILNMQSMERRR